MEKIYSILEDLRPEFDFHTSSNFIEDGLLDSFDMVALISELESAYDILIDALDIIPENFSSVEAIAGIVEKNGGKL